MTVRIVNLRKERFDLYIGRRRTGAHNKWANPYPINARRTRKQAIMEYERHLIAQIGSGEVTREELADLHRQGTVVGCFCAPQPCHGEVIALYAAAASECGRTGLFEDTWPMFLAERSRISSVFSFPGKLEYRIGERVFNE